MGAYQWVVLEGYPDGGLWRHFYASLADAEVGVELMRGAHPSRSYDILPVPD